jgi:hypothetical protein
MSRRLLTILVVALALALVCVVGASTAMVLGPSVGGLFGAPAETPTPTKTFVATFTATPSVQPSPTDIPEPTSTPEPTTPPEPPTPTQPPSPTVGPPTSTPKPLPPAPTATPKPPVPTNTPQPVYEFHHVSGPTKDPCHPGFCLPEIGGMVIDAQGNPIERYAVWIKLESATFGVQYCAVGDTSKMLQPGQFKFQSNDLVFGEYTLTVVRGQGDPTPLSPPLRDKMNSYIGGGQQTNIVFQRNH